MSDREVVTEIVDLTTEAEIDAMRLRVFRTNDQNDKASLTHMLVHWFGQRLDRRMDADDHARAQIKAAVQAERDACAAIADESEIIYDARQMPGAAKSARNIAAAIRSRTPATDTQEGV